MRKDDRVYSKNSVDYKIGVSAFVFLDGALYSCAHISLRLTKRGKEAHASKKNNT